ncbi:hypothetical protein I6F09_24050 [Bradyrhizobium sp. IC3195]|uniref:hypothetical protein n=1 Tax=Bradyrhizobium sp. IC3195 TaxID=2793804 RepID=UPI001CD55CD8|nr:hypothetical protein [Bradyrhizobium sp. IC3195]MCA1470959.1 hypothetical protein [Bradyrhizobium sp. IC3195]
MHTTLADVNLTADQCAALCRDNARRQVCPVTPENEQPHMRRKAASLCPGSLPLKIKALALFGRRFADTL